MSNQEDILRAISEYLGETADTEAQPAPPAPPPEPQQPPQPRPPRVGTTIQRSDRVNEQKRQMPLTQPPPPPGRRPIRPYEKLPPPLQKTAAEAPKEEILQPMGPLTAPPIKVEVEPGIIVEVYRTSRYMLAGAISREHRRGDGSCDSPGTGSSATNGKLVRAVQLEDPLVRPTNRPTDRSGHRAYRVPQVQAQI